MPKKESIVIILSFFSVIQKPHGIIQNEYDISVEYKVFGIIQIECDINLKGDIKLNNIYAETLILPNFTPKSCWIEMSSDANVVYMEYGIVDDTVIGYNLCSDMLRLENVIIVML